MNLLKCRQILLQTKSRFYTTKPIESTKDTISWLEYFKYKKKIRVLELVTTIPISLSVTAGVAGYCFNNYYIDPSNPEQMIYGLDPLMFFGALSLSTGLASFLLIPVVVAGLPKIVNPKFHTLLIKVIYKKFI